jgi:hypothetical protein
MASREEVRPGVDDQLSAAVDPSRSGKGRSGCLGGSYWSTMPALYRVRARPSIRPLRPPCLARRWSVATGDHVGRCHQRSGSLPADPAAAANRRWSMQIFCLYFLAKAAMVAVAATLYP